MPIRVDAQMSSGTVGRVQFIVEPGLAPDANALAEQFRSVVIEAETEFSTLFGALPDTTITLNFVTGPDPADLESMFAVDTVAWVNADGNQAVVDPAIFATKSPVEAANILRNLISRRFLMVASGGNLPIGLVDGVARYVETPVTARQARLGSLVQIRYQNGTLPLLGDVIAGRKGGLSAEEATAAHYALVSFIADRYGVANLRDLLVSFNAEMDWTVNFGTVLDQTVIQFNDAWQDYLPRWFASGWRENAFAHFDLGSARALFDRGAYEAAAAEAQKSQQLFSDLDDQARLSATEALMAQCAVGLQADGTMRDVEAALTDHDYARADALLIDADRFYAILPEVHRPVGLIERYRDLATQGQRAQANLENAAAHDDNLFELRGARADALSAGQTYVAIGDSDGLIAADALINRIDARIQRFVLIFAALTILVGAWSGVWIWNRSPGGLNWNRRAEGGLT